MKTWIPVLTAAGLGLVACENKEAAAPKAEVVPESEVRLIEEDLQLIDEETLPSEGQPVDMPREDPAEPVQPKVVASPTPGERLDRALEATGHGLQVAGEKTTQGVTTAAEKTEEALHTAGEKTEAGVKKAAEATGNFLRKVGEKIEDKAGGGTDEEAPADE